MRKTEMVIGVCAGAVGIILGLLLLFDLFPVSPLVSINVNRDVYAYICIAANIIGLAGGIIVKKRNFIGSGMMAVVMITIVFFGFPWQMISVTAYIVSIVLAVVPEKLHD
jgi:hypothetical protein